MFQKVFHIDPNDFEDEQFQAICNKAKKQGYKVFDFSQTSALDIENLDSKSWQTMETRDVLRAVNNGSIRADMVDVSSSTFTPDLPIDHERGFTPAEAWMLSQDVDNKYKSVQADLDKCMSYYKN